MSLRVTKGEQMKNIDDVMKKSIKNWDNADVRSWIQTLPYTLRLLDNEICM